MIRSRLAGSLRRQDWMAVGIELVTVVLGLFLGLQLNDWNDARQAHAREQAALVRLEQEAEADVTYFRKGVELNDRMNADREAAISALSTGDKAKFNSHELADRLGSLAFYPGVAPPRAVYDELSGSGLFNEIGSPSVRTQVASYNSGLGFIQSQLEYFRQGTTARFSGPSPGQTSVYDPNSPKLRDRFVYSADFDVIARDPVEMTRLVDALRDQIVFQTYRKGIEARAETMCKTLAQALGKTCAAAATSPRAAANSR
jgi:hypothetical protein